MKQLHIEPTSRCTLACPRCERTVLIGKFGKLFRQQDIDIADLDQFINTQIDSVYLCGNLGDPIYHPEFHKLIQMLRGKCGQIGIVTNGSYKKPEWWQQLSDLLLPGDEIEFSIDGSPENFTEYRVNANWPSIKQAILTMVKSPATVGWKYIPFSFNEDSIEKTRQLSKDLGVDNFIIDPSDRWWGEQDKFKPANQYQSRYKELGNAYNFDSARVIPKCINLDNHHFISADGYYTPCCYVKHHSFFHKSEWNNQKHQIKTSKLTKQLEYFWTDFSNTVQKNSYCKFFCGEIVD
jgi:MoaA/NifB/PqqE/SkfB family radical SAM enzyme